MNVKAPTEFQKGQKLLAMLVANIRHGRFKRRDPKTFISYGEALRELAIPLRGRAGQQLQKEGLTELNAWTQAHPEIPKITGFIINKAKRYPGPGFFQSHGRRPDDREWWLSETAKAIDFDWSPYLRAQSPAYESPDEAGPVALHEEPGPVDYRTIITIEPGKRGGKPCIRGMRITVGDVLGWLAAGMSHQQILSDFPELTEQDIRACLAFAAEKEKRAVSLPA